MKGQKQAVVELVKNYLPTFVPFQDVALVMLTKNQLEDLKTEIAVNIGHGLIEYSKNKTNTNEVTSYARSCVMNHLKKAKELNGNQTYGKTTTKVTAIAKSKALDGINVSLLPQDLLEFVNSLV